VRPLIGAMPPRAQEGQGDLLREIDLTTLDIAAGLQATERRSKLDEAEGEA